MDFSASENSLALDLETALSGLVKLSKALKFYPTDHPTLVAAAEETCAAFQPLLARHDTRPYHITKDGFSLDAEPLAPGNKSLQELALQLVERRVRHLLFLPQLENYELLVFAEEISKPAQQLLKEGGLPQRLSEREIQSIWINETDLEKILAQQNLVAVEPEATPEPSSGEEELPFPDEALQQEPPEQVSVSVIDRMRDLLEQLKEPLEDAEYQRTLTVATDLAPAFFAKTGIAGPLALLGLLVSQGQDKKRSEPQQQLANDTLDQLLTSDVILTLVNALAKSHLKASQRRALGRLLVGLGIKTAPALLQRLYAERDALIRRQYSSILGHMGTVLFDLLEKSLADPQWFVVRNAVTVLGETRLPEALPLLARVIEHPEVRVRRAAIRAISAIGGEQAVPLLVHFCQDKNRDLQQPAIIALGALGHSDAVAPLQQILQRNDFWGKQTSLKLDTIKALAATDSPQAIIPLLKLARRLNLLRRNHLERLRAEAILALGQLGNHHLLPLLERLPKSDKGPVNRALKHAKAQLTKA